MSEGTRLVYGQLGGVGGRPWTGSRFLSRALFTDSLYTPVPMAGRGERIYSKSNRSAFKS